MADRWTGGRSRRRSRERRRSRSRSRDRRRSRSRSRDRRRSGGGSERRRHSRSRSRSPRRDSRDHRRERSPSGRRPERSPPPRGGDRRQSRSPPPLRQPPALWQPPPPPGNPPPPHRSYGHYPPPPSMQPPPPPLSDVPPPVGSIHHARVVSVRPFGAFVDLPGYRKQALVHHSQISEDLQFGRDDDDEMKVKAMEFFLPRGQPVWVKILEVRQEPGARDVKLAASMRAVSQDDGADQDPDNALAYGGARGGSGGGPGGGGGFGGGGGRDSDEAPELYSIHRAAVQQVRPFGVFVKLDGYRKYGLVHFSQISDHLSFAREDADEVKMKEIGEILAVGDPVWVKVVDVTHDERGPKVGCSIKHASQNDGTDLDPANTKYRPRGGEGPGGQAKAPIGAQAGVAHGGAVDWGHLKADVVQYGTDGKQYDILADEAEERRPGGGRGAPLPPQAGPSGRNPPPPGPGFGSGANLAPLPPRGRGSGAVLPAWMTSGGGGAAPGSGGGGGGAPPPPPQAPTAPGGGDGIGVEGLQHITSIEQALAILEEHSKSKKSKHKHKHKSKSKKDSKSKKSKKERRRHSDSDSSGSDSD